MDDLKPSVMILQETAEADPQPFVEYLRLRSAGVPMKSAAVSVFGLLRRAIPEDQHRIYAMAAEFNPWVQARLPQAIEAQNYAQIWTVNRAVHSLLEIADNPETEQAVRVDAIAALNNVCFDVPLPVKLAERTARDLVKLRNRPLPPSPRWRKTEH